MHRHSYKGKKLQREKGQRLSLTRGLIKSLINNGHVVTTRPKAVAIRSEAEKLVTLAKKGDLTSRRKCIAKLASVESGHKLVDQVAPVFKDRNGGYTRIERVGYKRGDNSELVRLSFVDDTSGTKAAKPKVEAKKKPAAKAKTKPKVTSKKVDSKKSKKKDSK